MSIQLFFPTAIFSATEINLAEEMLPLAQQYLNDSNYISSKLGYKNTYDPTGGIGKLEEFQNFKEVVINHARKFLASMGYDYLNSDFIFQLFTSEMIAGDTHGLHTHPNSLLSGVFYLQVPEGSSPIYFMDPRPFRKIIKHPILADTEITWENIKFDPYKGLFLMWESWLEHEVPKNTNTEGRITLVFNLIRKE